MEPQKIYDYLVLSRQRLFDWVRPLRAEQWSQEFPIGLGTLGRTLTHIMVSEWFYVQRMERREVPPYEHWPIQEEMPPTFEQLERAWNEQAEQTRRAISAICNWGEPIEYRSMGGRPMIVTATAGDLFTQLALHEVHHRAQAMNMLRHMGVAAEDIDFNALMYKRRDARD